MPRIAATFLVGSSGVIRCTPKIYVFRPAGLNSGDSSIIFHDQDLPTDLAGISRRPSWASWNAGDVSRALGVGAWSSNILVDENYRVLRQGLPAPLLIPTLQAVAGSPGVSGETIGYIRYVDDLAGRWGPLSTGTEIVSFNNKARAWGNLPAPSEIPDPSVTHIEGLVSIDGEEARVCWRRQIGVTEVIEETPTLALGETAGELFEAMPTGRFNVVYNASQWIAGNEKYPERVFKSALGYPENYEGAYVQTDGEPVTGLAIVNDTLFFGSRQKIYKAQGFEDGDLAREIEKPDIGMLSHHGNCLIRGHLIMPSPIGFWLYNGAWNYIGQDRKDEWVEQFATYPNDFIEAQGYYDPITDIYSFGPVRHTAFKDDDENDLWVHWVVDCGQLFSVNAETGGFVSAIANDVRAGKRWSFHSMYLPGLQQPEVWSGGDDGYIRRENDQDDTDDDGDGYQKTLIIVPAPMRPESGGNLLDGCQFHEAWIHISTELTGWTAEFRAGGEYAAGNQDPDHQALLSADLEYDFLGTEYREAERTSRHHFVLYACGGSVLAQTVWSQGPKDVFWRGWGCTYGPGLAVRKVLRHFVGE